MKEAIEGKQFQTSDFAMTLNLFGSIQLDRQTDNLKKKHNNLVEEA